MTSGDAHLAVNYPLLLEKGLDGMRAKVAERRSRINLTVLEDLHGEQFLKAIDIVLEAVSDHSKRFAALAREMATAESRESRRHELLTIAENCDVIAHEPPKTFWQALQLCYFIQLILQIESMAIRYPSAVWTSTSTRTTAATLSCNSRWIANRPLSCCTAAG